MQQNETLIKQDTFSKKLYISKHFAPIIVHLWMKYYFYNIDFISFYGRHFDCLITEVDPKVNLPVSLTNILAFNHIMQQHKKLVKQKTFSLKN